MEPLKSILCMIYIWRFGISASRRPVQEESRLSSTVDLKVCSHPTAFEKRLFSAHWKARPLGRFDFQWSLQAEWRLKAKCKRKKNHFKMCRHCSVDARWGRDVRGAFIRLKVHYRSIVRQCLVSFPPLSFVCSAAFETSFIKAPGSKGAAAAPRLFRVLRVWPVTFLCYGAVPSV